LIEADTIGGSLTTVSLYIATGAAAGFSAGLLGIGGGLIIVPVLFYIFAAQGYQDPYLMHMALATSLATIIITSLSSTLAHHRKRAVLWRVVMLLVPGIGIGAWFGASLASELDTTTLKPVFGLFEIFVAILMLSRYQSDRHTLSINTGSALLGGGFIGGISSIVGIGGGTLTVPFLHWHNIAIKNAIATSAACGLPIAIFATASYIWNSQHLANSHLLPSDNAGFVNLHAFAVISLCSFMFAPLGAKLAHRIPDVTLKRVFSSLLLLLGISMIIS
jgi:uncharacterized membrane protein YfcA